MKKLLHILFKQNQLYKNSLYLITTNVVASAAGFLFWILIARHYSSDQIGLATSLFSLSSLVASLSLLGFNVGLMRYLPSSNKKNEKISSVIIITTIVSGILAIGFLLGLQYYSQPLLFVKQNSYYPVLFVFFTVINTLNILSESITVAYRAAFHVLLKVILQNGLKLILAVVLVLFGAFGIFLVLSLSNLIAALYAFIILAVVYKVAYKPRIDVDAVQKIAYISFGTYISGLASVVPSFVLPILITSNVSPSDSAYYYIVATSINILFVIPQVITQNLLVEGSYEEAKIKEHTRRAGRLIAGILFPAIIAMIFFGNYILIIFGKQYSTHGNALLQLLALSAIITGANYIVGTLLTMYNHIKLLIGINALGSVILLTSSYLLLQQGIIGIGYATILTQTVVLILYCFALYRVKKLQLLRFLF